MDARVPGQHFGDPGGHLRQAGGTGCIVKVCVPSFAPVYEGNRETGAY